MIDSVVDTQVKIEKHIQVALVGRDDFKEEKRDISQRRKANRANSFFLFGCVMK